MGGRRGEKEEEGGERIFTTLCHRPQLSKQAYKESALSKLSLWFLS